jgi:hypothetical protein
MNPTSSGHVSLAAIRPGEVARIRSILFQEVRSACAAAGVCEGDVVLCTGAGPSSILLSTSRGTAALPTGTARFVEVDRIDRPARRDTAARRDPEPQLGAHPAA